MIVPNSLQSITSVFLVTLVSLWHSQAYKVSHPKGNSYIYNTNSESNFGQRIPLPNDGHHHHPNEVSDESDRSEPRPETVNNYGEDNFGTALATPSPLSGHSAQHNIVQSLNAAPPRPLNLNGAVQNNDYLDYRAMAVQTQHPQRLPFHPNPPPPMVTDGERSQFVEDSPDEPRESLYVKEFEKQYKLANGGDNGVTNTGEGNGLVEGGQYPSILPEIAKVIYSHRSTHKQLQPGGALSGLSQLLNQPNQARPTREFVGGRLGRTESTAVTESSPFENYLGRPPVFEYITSTAPMVSQETPHNNPAPKYETNIESPPPKSTEANHRNPKAAVSYSFSSVPGGGDSRNLFNDQATNHRNTRYGRTRLRPLTPSAESQYDYGNDGGDEDGAELSTPASSQRHSPVPRPPHLSVGEHRRAAKPPPQPPKPQFTAPQFNAANSVHTGPNSFMTLTYEPLTTVNGKPKTVQFASEMSFSEPSRTASSTNDARHQSLVPQSSSSFYRANFRSEQREIHSPNYEQSSQSYPRVVNSVVEDQQQQPPRATSLRHQSPLLNDDYQSKAKTVAAVAGQSSYNANGQPFAAHSQPKRPQPNSASFVHVQEFGPSESAEKASFYRTFTHHPTELNGRLVQSQQSPQQSIQLNSDRQSNSVGYQRQSQQPEQAQASELEPVSNNPSGEMATAEDEWKHSVQRFAKEFGFEVPSPVSASISQVESSPPQMMHSKQEAHLFDTSPSKTVTNSVDNNNNTNTDSLHYFNVIYPQFGAPESESDAQPTNTKRDRSSILVSSRSRARPLSHSEANTFKHNKPHHQGSKVSLVDRLDMDSARNSNSRITNKEVDEILQKYNEVISNRNKMSAVTTKQAKQ